MPTPTASADERLLREIVAGTAAETGEAFFDELVRHLARATGAKCAWVTEWLPDVQRLRALAFWVGEDFHGEYEYDVQGTPCGSVIEERGLVHVPERVIELYATDPDLKPLGAVSYLGVPLFDTDGSILGHAAVMDDAPMPELALIGRVFEIFAGRATAELRRLRRDRDLREREQRLSRLVGSAMDAIVELDGELRVAGLNEAAARVFGCDPGAAPGETLERFLASESVGKLRYLARDLGRREPEQQSLWIPDGLEGHGADGALFPAEATLSRFELGGRPRYTLILRNVNERREAEERIRALTAETTQLRAEIEALQGFHEILGESSALRQLLIDVERVAGEETTVLITGETGTGKELVARALHRRSERAQAPLVTVNCAAIPESLQESEFFGHERGAFTGATQRREGRFQLAHGGTLFLDEVGEMPLDLQAKLLRVLQEGEMQPVGGTQTVRVDVRVVAGTNRDLERMVAEGRFREDLLYRLNVFPLRVPPLRERGDDVVLLAEAFARKLARARARGRTPAALSSDDCARLKAYDWPGNVRELQNVIERAWITSSDGRRLNLDRALPGRAAAPPPAAEPAMAPACEPGTVRTAAELAELERSNMRLALDSAQWKISGPGGAAERLDMNPNTLSSRMKALGSPVPRARELRDLVSLRGVHFGRSGRFSASPEFFLGWHAV